MLYIRTFQYFNNIRRKARFDFIIFGIQTYMIKEVYYVLILEHEMN